MFRMLREVTVDLNSARLIGGVNPLQIPGKILPISFFQDENIGDDLRSGESIVRQTVSLHKSRTPVRDLRHGTGFVHRGTGGQKDGMAIFLQTIQSTGDEIIMQIPGIVRTVIPVIRGKSAERNIADHEVILLRQLDRLQRCNPDV